MGMTFRKHLLLYSNCLETTLNPSSLIDVKDLALHRTYTLNTLLRAFYLGTFVFALTAATAGVKQQARSLRCCVVLYRRRNSGGNRPRSRSGRLLQWQISDWRYTAVSILRDYDFHWYRIIQPGLVAWAVFATPPTGTFGVGLWRE